MISNERVEAWFNGDIGDDELTSQEIRDLEILVNEAVTDKILARAGVHSFPEHKTLQ